MPEIAHCFCPGSTSIAIVGIDPAGAGILGVVAQPTAPHVAISLYSRHLAEAW